MVITHGESSPNALFHMNASKVMLVSYTIVTVLIFKNTLCTNKNPVCKCISKQRHITYNEMLANNAPCFKLIHAVLDHVLYYEYEKL